MKKTKPNYIDGFVFPIAKIHLDKYKSVAEKVANIWKEYGAVEYFEYVGDNINMQGTRSFPELLELNPEELVIFGWVHFPSKEVRDEANKQVPKDPRMGELVSPLMDPSKMIFDSKRMVYGGFQPLI